MFSFINNILQRRHERKMKQLELEAIKLDKKCKHEWEVIDTNEIINSRANATVGTMNIFRCKKCGDEMHRNMYVSKEYE